MSDLILATVTQVRSGGSPALKVIVDGATTATAAIAFGGYLSGDAAHRDQAAIGDRVLVSQVGRSLYVLSQVSGTFTALDSAIPVGLQMIWPLTTAPTGFLIANGQAVSRTTFADLFTGKTGSIGTTYGVGDGSTTFNLPDFRDRQPVGVSATKLIATTGGSATAALSASNLPPHVHNLTVVETLNNTVTGAATRVADVGGATGQGGTTVTGNTGTGSFANAAFSTQDPYLAQNIVIKW